MNEAPNHHESQPAHHPPKAARPRATSSPPGGHGPVALLVLGAIGIVYGDIGTSPLYTMTECFHGSHGVEPTPANVFGIISLVFWSLTLVVTIKYLTFLMRADNHGEGGIMALLALMPSEAKAKQKPGRVGFIAALVIAGAALLFGDGIITPAISVLSATEGLTIAAPSLAGYVMPVTVGILAALFLAQRTGTGGIGKAFGPVMVLWFLTLGILGCANIVKAPQILGAISPHHAVSFFTRNGWHGFRVLGGVVLAVTGGEALYADMGHFGRGPIRIAWLMLVFPALMLCYLGQGAVILGDPSGVLQPFYALMPRGPWIYPAVALASSATVIASQALISGAFSLTQQAIRLGYFPRIQVKHTSGVAEGQIYVPMVNWGLALACIALVLVFKKSSGLAAAYGLAVSGTMAITSVAFYVVTRDAWGWSRARSALVLALFLACDLPFLAANALKFFDGGYLPFVVGAAFVVVMLSWRIGRDYLAEEMTRQSRPLETFTAELDKKLVGRVPGTAVVLASQHSNVPPVLTRLVDRFRVMQEQVVLVTVTTERVPEIAAMERHRVERLTTDLSRVILRYGFLETPEVPNALAPALKELGIETPPDQLVYLLGRETLVISKEGRMGRVSEAVFALLSRHVRGVSDYFSLPAKQVVELGMQLDL